MECGGEIGKHIWIKGMNWDKIKRGVDSGGKSCDNR